MKTNEEIIEEVLKERNFEDDSRLIGALVNSGYCKTIVEASEEVDYFFEQILKKALAEKDKEIEKQKAEHENQVKAIIDVNEQKINQIKAEHLEFLKEKVDRYRYLGLVCKSCKLGGKQVSVDFGCLPCELKEEIARLEGEGKEK